MSCGRGIDGVMLERVSERLGDCDGIWQCIFTVVFLFLLLPRPHKKMHGHFIVQVVLRNTFLCAPGPSPSAVTSQGKRLVTLGFKLYSCSRNPET